MAITVHPYCKDFLLDNFGSQNLVLSHTYITQEGNGISAIVKPYRMPMKVAEKIVPLEKHISQLPKI